MEEANYLTKFASKVTIMHRRGSFRASKIMQDRALSNEKIDVMWNASVVEMLGDPLKTGLEAVIIEDTKTKKQLFIQGPFEEGTNNIGEFLALVHGLAILKKNKSDKKCQKHM